MSQKLIDEVGHKYGTLTVLSLTKDKNNRTAWLCKCDCGNTKIVRGSDLRTGKITTCGKGCPRKTERHGTYRDLTGQRFGRLNVLWRSGESLDGRATWFCHCDCGTEKIIRGSSLISGATKSCGCLSREIASERNFKDETGNRFGKLVVHGLFEKHPKAKWECLCDCGNTVIVKGIDLRSGNTKSCGCVLSWKEEEIANILKKNDIEFIRQYWFINLLGDSGKPLRFDFALIKKGTLLGLIEYQGEQHTKPIEAWGGEKALLLRQDYDRRKREYCKKNRYPLLLLDKNNKDLEKDILKFMEDLV